MSEGKQKPDWLTPELQAEMRQIRYDFHVRAFGEEMAIINALPLEERRKAVAEMYDHAKSKGWRDEKPALGYS